MSSLASDNFRMIISFQRCLFYQYKLLILNGSFLNLILPQITWISDAFNHTQFGYWSLIVVVVIFNHTHNISCKKKKLHYLCTDYWVLSIMWILIFLTCNIPPLYWCINQTFLPNPIDLFIIWWFDFDQSRFLKGKFPFKFIAIVVVVVYNNNKGRVFNILQCQNIKHLW